MNEQGKFKKRVLLCVTGMSPQIVTETLYYLVAKENFIPTEIRVITTARGRNHIMNGLLGGHSHYFEQFCNEYHLKDRIYFNESSIEVIKDKNGKELDDIKTVEENILAADQIVNLVRHLCADPDTALHVSMAGGRKTMGFYVGYALSLFAREQDKLSHVLVSEPYENSRDFYYPTQKPHLITLNNGEQVDSRLAQVILAEIPLVHLRSRLPENFLKQGNYSDTVDAIQKNLRGKLIVDIKNCTFYFPDKKSVKLEASHFAILYWLAYRKQNNQPAFSADENVDGSLFTEYLQCYEKVVSIASAPLEKLKEKALNADKTQKKKFSQDNLKNNENVKLLKKYMAAKISKLKKAIANVKGETFSKTFLTQKRETYGLSVSPQDIEILEK